MSPDEGLHIVRSYIDKGFRGVISCNLIFANKNCLFLFQYIDSSFVFKSSNAILGEIKLLVED